MSEHGKIAAIGEPKTVPRVCCYCSAPFMARASVKGQFCSPKCQSKHQRPPAVGVCLRCESSFSYRRGKLHQGGRVGKFCSRACYFAEIVAIAATKAAELSARKLAALNAVQCRVCGVNGRGVLCSETCRKTDKRERHRAKYGMPDRPCADCGGVIEDNRGISKWCAECRAARRREKKRQYRRAHKHARRARMRNAPRDPSLLPETIFTRDKWHCVLCGKGTPRRLRGTSHDCAPELDHIVPIALGGGHVYDNVQTLCARCNRAKGATIAGQLSLHLAMRHPWPPKFL